MMIQQQQKQQWEKIGIEYRDNLIHPTINGNIVSTRGKWFNSISTGLGEMFIEDDMEIQEYLYEDIKDYYKVGEWKQLRENDSWCLERFEEKIREIETKDLAKRKEDWNSELGGAMLDYLKSEEYGCKYDGKDCCQDWCHGGQNCVCLKPYFDKCKVCSIDEADCQEKFEDDFEDFCGLTYSKERNDDGSWSNRLVLMCPDCISDADDELWDRKR